MPMPHNASFESTPTALCPSAACESAVDPRRFQVVIDVLNQR